MRWWINFTEQADHTDGEIPQIGKNSFKGYTATVQAIEIMS